MIKFEFVLSSIFCLFFNKKNFLTFSSVRIVLKIVQYMVSQIKEIEIFYHLAKNYFVFNQLHINN